MTKIFNPSLSFIDHFVLRIYLPKITSWATFFIVSYIIPDFGRLLSLLTEAAQMTQNIKKKQTLSAWGVIKFT
jgi:hypothetical protein